MTRKSVLVVGAAGGTGMEVAAQLVAKNYHVVATVLGNSEAKSLSANIPQITDILSIDLSNPDAIEDSLGTALEQIGNTFAGVIVCAAKATHGPLELRPLSELRLLFEINVVADLAIYKACLPLLRKTKGRMVFLTSFGGKIAMPFIGHYITTKFALEGMCDVMRREAAHFGVPIIIVEPGGIRTKMVTDLIDQFDDDIAALSPDDAALYQDRYEEYRRISIKSMDTVNYPETIAKVVVNAFEEASPKARYQAGDDAKHLVDLAKRATDEELDEFLRRMYSQEGTITDMGSTAENSSTPWT
jgi:NAD(P)-dependent dehydrogenase (short-subunit alcohol dehydrogenase family)